MDTVSLNFAGSEARHGWATYARCPRTTQRGLQRGNMQQKLSINGMLPACLCVEHSGIACNMNDNGLRPHSYAHGAMDVSRFDTLV